MAPRHAAPFWAALLLAFALLATPAVASAASGRKVLSVETPADAPADAAAALQSAEAPADSPAPVVPQSPSPPPAESSNAEAPRPRAASSTTRRQQRKSDGPMPTTASVAPTTSNRRGAVAAPITVTEEGSALRSAAAPQAQADSTGAVAMAIPAPQIVSGLEYTPWNDAGERDGYRSIYLDRHVVGDKCDQGLNGWKLFMQYRSWPNTARMSFTYACAGASIRSFSTFRTGAQDWGGGSTVYMDRHNVECGANRVLSDWRLVRPSGNTIAIQYQCGNVPRTSNCQLFATPWANKGGGGQVNFFDRHTVQCPGNKKITRWQLQNDNNSNIRFLFNCCDA
ncbi:hypothetical protein Rsub_06821 [Raphidocelis subcapitata]|uniref:Uncharacterized protein n=1 Tax=Raphidocelis subcapitata TaxID=307507 RepID=A0A2V0P1H2_9CHLO|nr:hypothetical protein Rsub_06821 [Raphidocelis subcapitata]|eukprot:GBF93718.1 hypothetical protein Rsub_06821 [Raphidocelis subcapitata]